MEEQVNDNQVRSYDAVLDAKYGKPGSPERIRFEEEAYSFYFGQALRDTRKEAKVTQLELARRVGTSKSYISKVEHGNILPSIGAYCRLLNALGRDIEIVRYSRT